MRIETERLVLREFTPDDVAAVLAYQRDPRYLRLYPWEERTEEDVRDFVQRFVDQQRDEPRTRIQLAITLASSGEPIGNVGLRRASADARVADTGYEVAPAHWGRGYATEAARALVGHGFAALDLHRVHARCLAENVGSIRVLERLGMRREARLREHERFKGRAWDVLVYGVLASEWRG